MSIAQRTGYPRGLTVLAPAAGTEMCVSDIDISVADVGVNRLGSLEKNRKESA